MIAVRNVLHGVKLQFRSLYRPPVTLVVAPIGVITVPARGSLRSRPRPARLPRYSSSITAVILR
jgi:hypothetical protein